VAYTVPTEFGNFKLFPERMLGTGAYGSVYECQDHAGCSRAVKVIPMWRMQLDNQREQKRAELEHEIEVHDHIGQHENIVQLVESVEVEGDVAGWPRWKMVVLELAKGGELSELIANEGRVEEGRAKHIFKQIVSAVKHMHARRVIHRDLKSDNVLICTDSTHDATRPAVKLIDFGAGHWAKNGQLEATRCIGTQETMAPEVILARGDDYNLEDPTQIEAIHTAIFKTRPFGIRKYAPGPGGIGARVIEVIPEERYKGDPLGQAFVKGVRPGWVVKAVNGIDVTKMKFEDIIDLMGDRLLDNSSRGAFDGSFAVTGDNRGKGKVLPKVDMVDLPAEVDYVEIRGKPYGAQADVWSLGAILYEMMTGTAAFPHDQGEPAILEGRYEAPQGVSPQLADLISKILVVDPAKRLTLEEVEAHPWMA